jgi:hypothetical protein
MSTKQEGSIWKMKEKLDTACNPEEESPVK